DERSQSLERAHAKRCRTACKNSAVRPPSPFSPRRGEKVPKADEGPSIHPQHRFPREPPLLQIRQRTVELAPAPLDLDRRLQRAGAHEIEQIRELAAADARVIDLL